MSTPNSHPASTRPPRQSRTGLTSTGARKAASKSSRARAREFALQGLYQHLVGRNALSDIETFTQDLAGFAKADRPHFDKLLQGCIGRADALDALIVPILDRKLSEISPIERAVMWLGVFEFEHCLDVPWRVVLNSAVPTDTSMSTLCSTAWPYRCAQTRSGPIVKPAADENFGPRPAHRAFLCDGGRQSGRRAGPQGC